MMLCLGSRVGIYCFQRQSSSLETEGGRKLGRQRKKSGIILKDNCSKKVNIAVKYLLQGFSAMVAHKLRYIFFSQFIKPVLW